METISITVPREEKALLEAASFFQKLAGVEVEEELNPATDVEAMGKRIDATVAEAVAPSVDRAGMPWDARIHASSKATVADGTWRLKRNVSPELVEQVKAELLQSAAAVPPVAETPAAAVPPVETPAIPAVPPVETSAIPAVPPATITTYAELIPRITAQSNAEKLDANDVLNALAATGATAAGAINLIELAKPEHATYIPLVAAELERIWATRV